MASKDLYDLSDLDELELQGMPDSEALVDGLFLLIMLIIFTVGYFF